MFGETCSKKPAETAAVCLCICQNTRKITIAKKPVSRKRLTRGLVVGVESAALGAPHPGGGGA